MALAEENAASETPAAVKASSESKEQARKSKASELGDFKLMKKLGEGGMGEVYLARQQGLDRNVAIKVLSKELGKKSTFVERFFREARAMARLDHPNVLKVYAVETDKGRHYVAIELVDGQSMQDWIDQLGHLSVPDSVLVTTLCAEALLHAHEADLVHRDIKPDNVLVTKSGQVKVADFGLAKAADEDVSMTQSGTGMGTPLYMAPEQAHDAKTVDLRADIYALGCTLYHFLTGELPFQGNTALELVMAKDKGLFTSARKLNTQVPDRLDLLVDRMIAKDPDHRHANCSELLSDLNSLGLAGETLSFIEGPNRPPAAVQCRPGRPRHAPASRPRRCRRSHCRRPVPPRMRRRNGPPPPPTTSGSSNTPTPRAAPPSARCRPAGFDRPSTASCSTSRPAPSRNRAIRSCRWRISPSSNR